MNIEIESVLQDEFEEVLAVIKSGLFHHVDAVFGWDDDFQRNRLKTEYQSNWFHWIYIEKQRVGLLCFKPYENAFHIHFLVVAPSQQGKKIGTCVMSMVHDKAIANKKDRVTLSSFTRNNKAIAFYESIGYETIEADDNFVSMEWKPAS
ncbi:GNAT family N-acetyltransferase [Vibrio sp. 10N]|nr:GNAT family N-acetyltransferase [Vibrio sp. 10N]